MFNFSKIFNLLITCNFFSTLFSSNTDFISIRFFGTFFFFYLYFFFFFFVLLLFDIENNECVSIQPFHYKVSYWLKSLVQHPCLSLVMFLLKLQNKKKQKKIGKEKTTHTTTTTTTTNLTCYSESASLCFHLWKLISALLKDLNKQPLLSLEMYKTIPNKEKQQKKKKKYFREQARASYERSMCKWRENKAFILFFFFLFLLLLQ